MAKRCKTTITIDELSESLGLESVDTMYERMIESGLGDEAHKYAYDEAIADGYTEAQAEEEAEDASAKEQTEAYEGIVNAVMAVGDDLYGQHGLHLTVPTKMRGRGAERREVMQLDKIKVEPGESWNSAAGHIVETINGVGMFHYESVAQFIEGSTACEAVMSNLGQIQNYPEVYGSSSASRKLEGYLRNPGALPALQANPANNKLKNKLLR